jgi:hypothetical protein
MCAMRSRTWPSVMRTAVATVRRRIAAPFETAGHRARAAFDEQARERGSLNGLACMRARMRCRGPGTRARICRRARGALRRRHRAGGRRCGLSAIGRGAEASMARKRATRARWRRQRMLPIAAPIECPSTAKRDQPSASAASSTGVHGARERVLRADGQVRARAVSGQVEATRSMPSRCSAAESSSRVVEPSVQREHRRARAAAQAGEAAVGRVDGDFAERARPAHAAAPRSASAASTSACAGASLRQGM